ncbi:hypothetical protein QBE53_11735 [Vallitaleaceae bacterium 9-2]
MKKGIGLLSLLMLAMTLVYLIGFLPWMLDDEERIRYIISTIQSYEGLEIDYTLDYEGMQVEGSYEWLQQDDEHRFKGMVTSDQLEVELIHIHGMVQDNGLYIQMGDVIPQVYRMDLGQQEDEIQNLDLNSLLDEVEQWNEPQFKLMTINQRLVGGYVVTGSSVHTIQAQKIIVDYTLVVDGWGNIRSITAEIQMDKIITFNGTIRPIKNFNIEAINKNKIIDF